MGGILTINTGWEDDLVQQRRPLSVTIGHDALFWRCQAFSSSSHPCAQSVAQPQTVSMVLSYRLQIDITWPSSHQN